MNREMQNFRTDGDLLSPANYLLRTRVRGSTLVDAMGRGNELLVSDAHLRQVSTHRAWRHRHEHGFRTDSKHDPAAGA